MKPILPMLLFAAVLISVSCNDEDPGPRQSDSRNFAFLDFNRVDAGYGLVVTIIKSSNYSIEAIGDRRNLDDLVILKNGNSLVMGFTHSEKRQYLTYVNISMPDLQGINFSGSVNGTVAGFSGNALFDATLSGASLAQINISSETLNLNVSGASQLLLAGSGEKMNGIVSGASLLSSFDYPVNEVVVHISGASSSRLSVSQQLKGSATGSSLILYRGQPSVEVESSGESMVRKD
jgi:hypothetical protein